MVASRYIRPGHNGLGEARTRSETRIGTQLSISISYQYDILHHTWNVQHLVCIHYNNITINCHKLFLSLTRLWVFCSVVILTKKKHLQEKKTENPDFTLVFPVFFLCIVFFDLWTSGTVRWCLYDGLMVLKQEAFLAQPGWSPKRARLGRSPHLFVFGGLLGFVVAF